MSQQQPPPAPLFILRGHSSQIHSLTFLRQNTRLITADSDGYVILWNVPTRRPVAAWKAHEGSILEVRTWGDDKIITHGRDNKLHVWKLGLDDEAGMDTVTPADVGLGLGTSWRKPWLLNSIEVNALNFCSFAETPSTKSHTMLNTPSIFVVFPSNLDSEGVDIWQLPEQKRLHMGIKAKDIQTGMAMSLRLFWLDERNLALVGGYESGHVCLYVRDMSKEVAEWKLWFARKEHSQPVLSIEVSPDRKYILSSSADAIIVKHSIPVDASEDSRMKSVDTKHSGQQSIRIRDDGKIFATAGWDKMVRVYSMKTMKELAVLKWHREGVYAVGFGTIKSGQHGESRSTVLRIHGSSTELPENTEQAVSTVPTSGYLTLEQRRDEREISRHWIAAGAKDGKVSLWEIY